MRFRPGGANGDPAGWRRWLAAAVPPLAVLAGAVFLLTRDREWESRWREAGRLGRAAERRRDPAAARRHYEAALAEQPYDWECRLALAAILDRDFHDNRAALANYLLALAGMPDGEYPEDIARRLRLLRLIRSGVLEDPADAAADMFLAAEAGAKRAFCRRLSPRLSARADEHWAGWRRRGRGEAGARRLLEMGDGSYAAVLRFSFPDQSILSFRFTAEAGGFWRLEQGFP